MITGQSWRSARALTIAHVNLNDPMPWTTAVHLALTAEQSPDIIHACADSLVFFCREEIPRVLTAIKQGISNDEYSTLQRVVYDPNPRVAARHGW